MAGLAQKKETVEALKQELEQSTIAVVADYRGLTVSEITKLRADLYQEEAKFSVAKNTLTRRAIDGTERESLKDTLKGPTAILLGRSDQVAPVKILKKFLKENKKKNEIRGGYMDGRFLTPDDVEELAKLPSLPELQAKLLGAIASPATGLVAALSSPQRGLVNVLDQFAKKKQAEEAAS